MLMKEIGFDNQKYVHLQSEHIKKRIAQFGGKLYLEFGGKLFDDFHASRVLPGFEPDSKVKLLLQLKEQAVPKVLLVDDNDYRLRGFHFYNEAERLPEFVSDLEELLQDRPEA